MGVGGEGWRRREAARMVVVGGGRQGSAVEECEGGVALGGVRMRGGMRARGRWSVVISGGGGKRRSEKGNVDDGVEGRIGVGEGQGGVGREGRGAR